jgi:hypothetical protein
MLNNEQIEQIIENIAKKHFRIPNLKTINSDRADFVECAKLSLRKALLEAFEAGIDVLYQK